MKALTSTRSPMVIVCSTTPERRAPHDQRHGDCDDRALPDVEQRQRGLALDRRRLPALQAFVVAPRFEFLVVEILDRLVIEQTVDRARIRLGIELVHLPPEAGAPFGYRHRVDDVQDQRAKRDADEPQIVASDEDRRHQRDFDERRQDREQRVADQSRYAAGSSLDVARQAAGLPREMEAQRQRVQMAEGLQRNRAHGALRHLGEQVLAQLSESSRRQPQRTVGREQRQRQNQRLPRRDSGQPIDDLLQYQRHTDVGELGRDQTAEGEQHAALVCEQIGQQRADRVPVAAGAPR